MKPLLNCDGTNWVVKVDTLGGLDGSLSYYGFTCTLAAPQDADNTVPAGAGRNVHVELGGAVEAAEK